ncbi:MAG: hypothetical protein JRC86_02895 [Deltaproteobacteria bacterium]|nr:hypothetical protein [Deltaproteobacteria bacterium]
MMQTHTNDTKETQIVAFGKETPVVIEEVPESINESQYSIVEIVEPGQAVSHDMLPGVELDFDTPVTLWDTLNK